MAGLKVFVSSTCYDLSVVRSQLRLFIQNIGHEPVMSDYNDILYDHRVHTHTSCVDEVATCDVVVLIVGARFGGKTVPEALGKIDFDKILQESKSTESLKSRENLSVTQLEILKAVETGIPVFTFIDDGIWHDHALYEKNKEKKIISDIEFPSIQKPETAKFIFEFINFLRHRVRGNSVFPFSKLQDIEEILRRQWSQLFQKLLLEQKSRTHAAKRFDDLSEQFEDLKTAILTTIGSNKEREVARGVVRYRRLLSFIRSIGISDMAIALHGSSTWGELMAAAGIVDTINSDALPPSVFEGRIGARTRTILTRNDHTFFEVRAPHEYLFEMKVEWDSFVLLPEDTREIIAEALSDMPTSVGMIRHIPIDLNEFIDRKFREFHDLRKNSDRGDLGSLPPEVGEGQ
ncbi:MAG: DUF4062 domain-containing protein [Zoogloea sp.]|uniref:DUF4062 domain-containing protein n=1 Tax=Zoogloea sp. TaxID=49181 RepID=UPI003F3114E9